MTADAGGSLLSSMCYTAFGETRYASGSTSTDYRYTGQREEAELELYYYVARWYDPALGRFIQPDTIVPNPGNPMDWDRYAYVRNNPVNFTDPTGHMVSDPIDGAWWDEYTPVYIMEHVHDDVVQEQMLVAYMYNHPNYSPETDQQIIDTGYDPASMSALLAVERFKAEVLRSQHNKQSLVALWNNYAAPAIVAGIVLGGGPSGSLLTLDDLSRGASLPDRNGLTYAGRSLQKHSNRPGSAFTTVKGNPTTLNEAGQTIVDDILTTPGTTVKQYYRPGYGNVIDVRAPDGRGLRFDANSGKLIGFLEP